MSEDIENEKTHQTAEQFAGVILIGAGAWFGLCSAGATYMGFETNTGFFTALVGIPLWLTALGLGIATGSYFAQRRTIFALILLLVTGCLTFVNGYIDTISLTEVSANREEDRLAHNTRVKGARDVLNKSVQRKTEIDDFMARARHENPDVVKDAQRQLKDLGFYVPGVVDECTVGRTRIDGERGGCTEEALQAWQQFYRIPEELRDLEIAIKENGELAKIATIDEPSIFTKDVAEIVAIIMNLLAFVCTVGAGYFRRGESELEKVKAERRAMNKEVKRRDDELTRREQIMVEEIERRERHMEEDMQRHKDEMSRREQQLIKKLQQRKDVARQRTQQLENAFSEMRKMVNVMVSDINKREG